MTHPANLSVAAFQFDVRRGSVEANLSQVEAGLRDAAARGIELVLLPEMWSTSFVAEPTEALLAQSDRAVERVRALSRELQLSVAGSAYSSGRSDAAPFNRLRLFQRGEELLRYDKVHLFSPTAETEGFTRGEQPPPTVAVGDWRVSGVICYDLRFGRLLRTPLLSEAELLLVPAQWPDTRASHWRALVLGRAVEHQAYVLASNRTGTDRVGRRELELAFPGNSMIASPHGEVLAEGRGEPGLVAATLDRECVRTLRRRVPVRRDERS